MEMTDIEFKKALVEFGKTPSVGRLKVLIDEEKEDSAKLKSWSEILAGCCREDPVNSYYQNLMIWFMYTYLKISSKNIQTNRGIINMVMDESIDDNEVRECFNIEEEHLRYIIAKGIQSIDKLKESIEDEISMFSGRKSLNTELRIITKIEKERETLNGGVLKSELSKPCLIDIHKYLNRNGLNSALKMWLCWFGHEKDITLKPMKWNGSDQALANVMHRICGKTTKKTFLKAFDKETLPNYHTDFPKSTIGIAIENIIQKHC
jgi:hypothetical protein